MQKMSTKDYNGPNTLPSVTTNCFNTPVSGSIYKFKSKGRPKVNDVEQTFPTKQGESQTLMCYYYYNHSGTIMRVSSLPLPP